MSEKKTYQWKVCIKCFTYNQSSYILDALNGFTMQHTDFPYVCCIVDDCSTDGEQEVIKKYLQDNFDLENKFTTRNEETENYILVFARHRINKKCYFAVFFLKYNHYSNKKNKTPHISEWYNNAEYIAMCEGDDFWTDVNKLQRQVVFMESHPTYSAISENGIEIFTQTGEKRLFSEEPARFVTISELIEKRRFPTASVLFRKDALDERYTQAKTRVDTLIWCLLASKGSFYYNAINSSVYRRGPGITVTLPPYIFAQKQERWHRELQRLFPLEYSKKSLKYTIIRSYIAAANRYLKSHKYVKELYLCYFHAFKINIWIFICVIGEMYIKAFLRKFKK